MSSRYTIKSLLENIQNTKSEHTQNIGIKAIQKRGRRGDKVVQKKDEVQVEQKKQQQDKQKKYVKQKISAALREQVWIQHQGENFRAKCAVTWCQNKITVFDFQCGHDIPESKGGPTDITNLYPICSKCNLSMGNQYTFKEWCALCVSVNKNINLNTQEQPQPFPKKLFKRSWKDFFFCCQKHIHQDDFSRTGGV